MLVRAALLTVIGTVTTALAAPCGKLAGDAALVSAVEQVLQRRAVRCDAVHAHLAYDGTTIVITSDDAMPLERRVADIEIAATVIESWSATIVDPLLAIRPIPVMAAALPVVQPSVVIVREAPVVAPLHGYQLFAAAETSVADDRTSWLGAQVGGCIVIGPLCATARLRFASVIASPWTNIERRGNELLIGADIPFRMHSGLLMIGFGGGLGEMHTQEDGERHMGSETAGLRADVHTSWAYPVSRDLSIDFSVSIDLTQSTRTESSSTMPLPGEPLVLGRLGIGIRYGRLM